MEFKPTSGLESTTSQKSRDFTRQQAEIRDKQKTPAQDSPTLNNEKAMIKSKSVSGPSTLFSGKSIDYSLQKAKIGDEQKMSSQDSSTSNNQVARDSKPRSRLEHSKSKESPKNIIDTLREKGATEQEIAQFKEDTNSLYQKTLDMWKKYQPEEFSRNDRLQFFQTTIQVFESWHQVHKEQATEQEIAQFKEHTNSLYQQTLDMWKKHQPEEFSRNDRLNFFQTTIQVFELWHQVHKEQATEQEISQFKEHTTSLDEQTRSFSQEMLKECRSKNITREYYLEADKNAIKAFDLWIKANIE